ncbi:hypothetical protein EZ313_02090 [Ramlibacter henchirensis]|uniref:Uncharacterized protein n=1 Tax=Ramlibacter henchirensis TaxID=204072 RepID=A0A4Z0C604_9BURK|nr:hypothetical protein [Ramlibacter henchirensis]TFZ05485.1 hypothetical protein EZ313_02090 [Ramlibacter henchirensis]
MQLDSPLLTLSEQLALALADEARALLQAHQLRKTGRPKREVEGAITEFHARHAQVARLQLQLELRRIAADDTF